MKKILWIIIFLIVILLVAVVLHHIPSYILLQIGGCTIAMPLWLFVDALIIVLVILYYLIKMIKFIWHLPRRFKDHHQARKQQRHMQMIKQALTHWVTDQYDEAAAMFTKLAQCQWYPTQSLLMAAKAAHLSGKQGKKLDILNQIKADKSDDKLALLLVKFDTAMQQQDNDVAQQVLGEALKQFPKNEAVCKRALALHQFTQDFSAQLVDIDRLQGMKNSDPQLEQFRLDAYQGLLAQLSGNELNQAWQTIPGKLQKSSQLIYTYAQRLLAPR